MLLFCLKFKAKSSTVTSAWQNLTNKYFLKPTRILRFSMAKEKKDNDRITLYHSTSKEGRAGVAKTKLIKSSTKEWRDVYFGDGVYFMDMSRECMQMRKRSWRFSLSWQCVRIYFISLILANDVSFYIQLMLT